MSSDSFSAVSLEMLQAEWDSVQEDLPERLGLRLRRALSWLERAEKESNDPDAAFIFY